MKTYRISFLCCVIISFLCCTGFTWRMENEHDETVVYTIYWENIELDAFKPANIAGGELVGGSFRALETDWPPGVYHIRFADRDGNWTNYMELDLTELDADGDYTVTLTSVPQPVTITLIKANEH